MTDTVAELNDALIGRYLVEKEIGQGGMATVYLARDLRHDRPVAIKVLHPELAAVLGPERFVAEMKVTANLQHPHILPLFDSGTARSQLFYVMPFVQGESLRDKLTREQQLPVEEAIRIATEVAGALDYAHRHGVVHRDIKPENILLHDGTALVADFGIALAVSNAGGTRLTQTGLSLGTPQYMSPEQATGDRNIDGRTDVYSLGCMVYEMLTGEPPFTGPSSQAIVARVLTEQVRPIRARRDTVPQSVEDAVLKAVQKLPADRFATPAAFAAALRHPGTAAVPAFRRVVSPRRWSAYLWPALAVAAIAAAVWFALHRGVASDELQLARQLTFDGNVTVAAMSPDGKSLAYVTDDCLGQAFVCNQTLRVRDVDGTQSLAILKSWRAITDVKWSPDAALLAVHGSPDSTAGAVYLTDKLGGSLRPLRVTATAMAFTQDSRFITLAVGTGRQQMVRYDAATLAPRDSSLFPAGWAVGDLAYSPAGNRLLANVDVNAGVGALLALLTTQGAIVDSAEVKGGRAQARWTGDGSAVLEFEFAPGISDNLMRIPVSHDRLRVDRESIALGQVPTGYLGVLDAAPTGRVVVVLAQTSHALLTWRGDHATPSWQPLTSRTGYLEPWSISPDGHFVAAAATDNLSDNIVLFPLDSSVSFRAVTATRGEHEYPRWSPDGKHLAYLSWAVPPAGLVMIDAQGGSERPLLPTTSRLFAWASNDAIVTMRADTFVIVDTTGKERRRVVIAGTSSSDGQGQTLMGDVAGSRYAYWSDAASGLVVADLDRGTSQVVAHHHSPLVPLGWAHDGSVYAYEQEDAGEGGSDQRVRRVIRIPAAGGAAVAVVTLPADCSGVVLDADARHIVCDVRCFRPDVWLADRAGRSGW